MSRSEKRYHQIPSLLEHTFPVHTDMFYPLFCIFAKWWKLAKTHEINLLTFCSYLNPRFFVEFEQNNSLRCIVFLEPNYTYKTLVMCYNKSTNAFENHKKRRKEINEF